MMRALLMIGVVASAALAQSVKTPAATEWLDNGRELRSAFEALVKPVRPAVVEIRSVGEHDARLKTLGTAVGPDLVVTKASEVGKNPKVMLIDERELTGEVVARSDEWDLALVRAPGAALPAVKFVDREFVPGTVLVNVGQRTRPHEISTVSWKPRAIPKDPGQPQLGVMVQDQKPKDGKKRPGVIVMAVAPGSPASELDIKKDDVLTAFDGKPIKNQADFFARLMTHEPGEKVTITRRRGDDEKKLDAVLAKRKQVGPRHAAEVNLRLSDRRDGFPLAVRHDATLSMARQGGPVLDLAGHVVGINIARSGRTQCLLLPAKNVREVVDKLRAAVK